MKKHIIDWFWRGGTAYSPTALPTPTDFTGQNVANLTDAVGASVSQTALNTASGFANTKYATLANPFAQRFQTLQLVGTSVAPFYWKSLSDSTRSWIGGTVITTGQKVMTQTGGTISDFHVFEHFGVKGDPDPAVTGVIGISWTARVTTGTTAVWRDIIVTDTSSAGIQINDGVTANFYESLTFDFVRVIGDAAGLHQGTEGYYIGSTNTGTYSMINNSTFTNGLIAYRGWDGLQFNGHANISVSNYTVYDVGNLNAVGQRNLLQAQNVKGTISNCIFWDAPDMFVIAATGLNLVNCYFYSTGAAGLWQDLDLDASYGASSLRDHTPNTITNCHFYTDAAVGYAIDFREGNTDTTFTNCTTNKAALYLDNRVDTVSYTLSETGTTTSATIPSAPTFNNLDATDETHGILQDAYWRNTNAGYRN